MGNIRTYSVEQTVTFCKTREQYGELSNCHMGFPLWIPEHRMDVKSVEHLYQALKHPNDHELQQAILDHASPIGAKKIAYAKLCRPDWLQLNIPVMRYLLALKTVQHNDVIVDVLRETGEFNIVEFSNKDKFWGAGYGESGSYVGINALGRLWMERRELALAGNFDLPEFPDNVTLFGKPVFL